MAPVRVVRAFPLPIIAIRAALALSGCRRTTGPVAVAQPQGDLDSLAYGQPYNPAPAGGAAAPSDLPDSGGAISALRASFAAAPRRAYEPGPGTYAAAPMPVAHDAAYRLHAGDQLRGGGFCPEGLTNTYTN